MPNQWSMTENAIFQPGVRKCITQIRNMTKINAASNTAKPFMNMEALMESSGIKVKWVISSV